MDKNIILKTKYINKRLQAYRMFLSIPPYDFVIQKSSSNQKKINKEVIEKLKKIKGKTALYLHFPFCPRPCKVCLYYKIPLKYKQEYLGLIEKEIKLYSKYLSKDARIYSLYIGGGTPNFITGKELNQLLIKFKKYFGKRLEIEQFSTELHPAFKYQEFVNVLLKHFPKKAIRINIGAQSFDKERLLLYREPADPNMPNTLLYSKEDIIEMIEWLHKKGIWHLNLDFIYKNLDDFNKEYKDIKNLSKKYKVTEYTLYQLFLEHAGAKSQFKELYYKMKPVEIVQLREKMDKEFKKIGFKVYIKMHYFTQDEKKVNLQSVAQLEATNQLVVGLSSRGVIENSVAINSQDFSEYKKILNQNRLPVKYWYVLSKDLELIRKSFMPLLATTTKVPESAFDLLIKLSKIKE